MRAPTVHAEVLDILKADAAGSIPDGEMLQPLGQALVDMQVRFSAKGADALFSERQRSVHAQGTTAGRQKFAGRIRVVKACQR